MTSHEDRRPSQHSAPTLESGQAKSYKSPRRKLVCFFEKSRNKWKAKCRDAKTSVKRLSNRIRFLAKSKDRWKRRSTELEAELGTLKADLRARDKEIGYLKKKRLTITPSEVSQGIARCFVRSCLTTRILLAM